MIGLVRETIQDPKLYKIQQNRASSRPTLLKYEDQIFRETPLLLRGTGLIRPYLPVGLHLHYSEIQTFQIAYQPQARALFIIGSKYICLEGSSIGPRI